MRQGSAPYPNQGGRFLVREAPVIDLLDDNDDDYQESFVGLSSYNDSRHGVFAGFPIAAPSRSQNGSFRSFRSAASTSSSVEVIDLVSSDDESVPPPPPPPPSHPASPPPVSLPPPAPLPRPPQPQPQLQPQRPLATAPASAFSPTRREANGTSNHTSSSASQRSYPSSVSSPVAETPARRPRPASANASEVASASVKKRRIHIKQEFPPKGFGEANVGDEVVEIEPETQDGSDDNGDLQNGAQDTPRRAAASQNQQGGAASVASSSLPTTSTMDDDDDIEFEIIGSRMTVASEMPHQREACTMHPFSLNVETGTPNHKRNMRFCSQCYCYVCQEKASECPKWEVHCNATYRSPLWKAMQKMFNGPHIKLLTPTQRGIYSNEFQGLAPRSTEPTDYYEDDDDDDYDYGYYAMQGRMYHDNNARNQFMIRKDDEDFANLLESTFCNAENDADRMMAFIVAIIIQLESLRHSTVDRCKGVLVCCMLHALGKQATLDALTEALAKREFWSISQLLGHVRAFVQNPNDFYSKHFTEICALPLFVQLRIIRSVFTSLDPQSLKGWIISLPTVSYNRVLLFEAEALQDRLPSNLDAIQKRITFFADMISSRHLDKIGFTKKIPVGMLRLVALCMRILPSEKVDLLLHTLLTECLPNAFKVHQIQEVVTIALSAAASLDADPFLNNSSSSGMIQRMEQHIRANTSAEALLAYAIVLALVCVRGRKLSADLQCVLVLNPYLMIAMSNVVFRWQPSKYSSIVQACTFASHSLVSRNSSDDPHPVDDAIITELTRLPLVSHIAANGEHLQQYNVVLYSSLPSLPKNVLLQYPSYSELMKALLGTRSSSNLSTLSSSSGSGGANGAPGSKEQLLRTSGGGSHSGSTKGGVEDVDHAVASPKPTSVGSPLAATSTAQGQYAMEALVGCAIPDGDVYNITDRLISSLLSENTETFLSWWDSRRILLRCYWKALILHLHKSTTATNIPGKFSVANSFELNTVLEKKLHLFSSADYLAKHSAQDYCLLHGILCMNEIACYRNSIPYVICARIKGYIQRLMTVCEAHPAAFKDLHALYMLEAAQSSISTAAACCSLWRTYLYSIWNGASFEEDPSSRFALAVIQEDWERARSALFGISSLKFLQPLARWTVKDVVWPSNHIEANYIQFSELIEATIKKVNPYSTSASYAELNAMALAGVPYNLLWDITCRFLSSTVVQYATDSTPLLCARLTMLLEAPSLAFHQRAEMESLRATVLTNTISTGLRNLTCHQLLSLLYTKQLNAFLASLPSQKPDLVSTILEMDGGKGNALNVALAFCPESLQEDLVQQISPFVHAFLHTFQPLTVASLTARIANCHTDSTKRRWELLTYIQPITLNLSHALAAGADAQRVAIEAAAPGDENYVSSLQSRFVAWLLDQPADKFTDWETMWTMLRMLVPVESIDRFLFAFRPSHPTTSIAMAVELFLSWLPLHSNRDSLLCVLAHFLMEDPSLLKTSALLQSIQPDWLEAGPISQSAPEAEEIDFAKAFLLLLRDASNATLHWNRLQNSSQWFPRCKLKILRLLCDKDDVQRSIDFHLRLCEYEGLVTFLREVANEDFAGLAFNTAISCLTSAITADTLIASSRPLPVSPMDSFDTKCLATLVYSNSFLRAMFELFVSVKGVLHRVVTNNSAMTNLAQKLSALLTNQPFLQNYLDCAQNLMANFDMNLLCTIPIPMHKVLFSVEPSSGVALSGPIPLWRNMFEVCLLLSGVPARLYLLENLITLVSRDAFKGELPLQSATDANLSTFVKRIFFTPTFDTAMGFHYTNQPDGLLSKGAVSAVIPAVISLINKNRPIMVPAFEETLLCWLRYGDPSQQSPEQFDGPLQKVHPNSKDVLAPWILRDSRLREICAAMVPIMVYFKAFHVSQEPAAMAENAMISFVELSYRPQPIFALWKDLIKSILFSAPLIRSSAPARISSSSDLGSCIRIICLAQKGRRLLSENEEAALLKRIDFSWMLENVSRSFDATMVTRCPSVLNYLTEQVMRHRDLAAININIAVLWETLIGAATEETTPLVVNHIAAGLVAMGYLLVEHTISVRVRSTLNYFIQAIAPSIRKLRSTHGAEMNTAIASVMKALRQKKPVVAVLGQLLQ